MFFPRTILSLMLLIIPTSLFPQAKPVTSTSTVMSAQRLAETNCDCKNAIKININKVTTYGLTRPPAGAGVINEIGVNSKSNKFNFEEEHNSSWYLLNIHFDGEFVFEIIPQDSSNDYDFLLYKYTDTSFCNALVKKALKPVRSNLSRSNLAIKGYTGLSTDAKDEFVGQGVKEEWSRSIQVTKGDKYVLVLDNVYPNGLGHTIKFNYIKQVTISGMVVGSDSLPLKAEVVLNDNNGAPLKEIITGNDGKYSFTVGLKENLNYSIVFSSDSSFIAANTINTTQLLKTKSFTDIKTVLPRLKKGEKYKIYSINFYGDTAILLPESYPSVEALYKLMKKNKKMFIRIEGHVNGSGRERDPSFNQNLSDRRAQTVSNYLTSKGIEPERIKTIGFSDKMMVYPNPKNEKEASANRRVEINVLSIE